MPVSERNRFSVGAYNPEEIGAVIAHAESKRLRFETVVGPVENFQLDDGTKISVAKGLTAVVLIATDITAVHNFWDGFAVP